MAQYTRNPPLTERSIDRNPVRQLERWIEAARRAGMQEPTAMTLATVDRRGQPSARMVLFKGMNRARLTFFTNFDSRKGRELSANPRVALVFWWDKLERQVRVEGRVERLPASAAAKYFHSRLRESQIGAVVSRQSQIVASREELDARFDALVHRLGGRPVPLPDYWGGYAVTPERMEFWQGRRGRLHDRLLFTRRRTGKGQAGAWKLCRLEP